MNKLARLQATVAAALLLLCSCENGSKELLPPAKSAGNETNRQTSVMELQRLYQAAGSEQERRSVCLRSIDEGLVHRGGPVLVLDQIFGTRFASDLPEAGQIKRGKPILFATQPSPPDPSGPAVGVGYVGSYLYVEYDHEGKVQYYYISNLHKGLSAPIVGRKPITVVELKRLYGGAKSEAERREVALKAIDDGVIRTFSPVNVSIVDEIFGMQLASHLPTKKERTRTGFVDFSSPASSAPSAANQTSKPAGWFLAVDYSFAGDIENYYLTNIRK